MDNPVLQNEPLISAKRAIVIGVVYFLAPVLFGICLSFVVGMYFAATQKGADFADLSDAMAPLMLPIGLLSMVVAGLVVFWMVRRTLNGPVAKTALVSLGWRASSLSNIAIAMATGCILSLIYLFFLTPLSSPAEDQEWGPLVTSAMAGGWQRILWAIFALSLAPPIEEFVFRGVLFSGLSNTIGVPIAAFIVTIAFVLAHASEAQHFWPAWVGISLLACATVILRIRTGSLLPAIAAHACYNLVLVLAVFYQPS